MDEQDDGLEDPMNPSRRTVPQMFPLAATVPVTVALTMFLTVAPLMTATATAQSQPVSLREAGEAAATAGTQSQSQSTSCVAKAQEWLKECEAEEREENEDGVPDRTGLGWTGIGLASAGVVHTALGIDVSRWRHCGPGDAGQCRNLERVYLITGGTLLATGLTFLITDEVRRHRHRSPKRQTAIAIGPRAIEVRMSF